MPKGLYNVAFLMRMNKSKDVSVSTECNNNRYADSYRYRIMQIWFWETSFQLLKLVTLGLISYFMIVIVRVCKLQIMYNVGLGKIFHKYKQGSRMLFSRISYSYSASNTYLSIMWSNFPDIF